MRTSKQIQAEIEAKFGFFPTFFSPALQTPQVLENLWQQTLSAYVTNPLPALFKEKLSAYLSRYCAVPYCMICHSCSLYFLGMKAKEVLKLLQSPPIEEIEIDKYLHILAQASNELMLELEFNPAVEESLLYCAIFISLEKDSAYCRSELRCLLGDVNYQHLVTFIAYVKTCHVWMEAHPEVALAADKRAIDHLGDLVDEEPGLADFFDSYEEKVRQERQNWAQATAVLAERQRSLEALRKAANENLRLAKAVASVSDAVVVTDPNRPDNPIVYVNSAFEQMTGYLSSGIIGRNCRFLQGADTDPQAIAQIKQGIAAQREVKTTLLNYRACGQAFWNELKISPVFSDSSDLLYFVGISTDITERKRAESLLLGQNRILETIASGASLPHILESLTQMIEQQLSGVRCFILLLDRNGNLVLGAVPSLSESYNQAIDRVTIGSSVSSCGTAADLDPTIVSDIANDLLWADLGDLALEHELRSCWSTPIVSTSGNVLGTFAMYDLQPASPSEHQLQVIEVAVNLAGIAIERQQAESALRERENRWRTIIDTEPECVKLVAADGTLLEMNAAGLAMIEVESADAVIGRSVYSLIAPDYLPAFQTLHKSVCNGRKGTLKFEMIGTKGSRRWLETHAVPLVNESDGTFLHLAITRDLTERKQAEEAWLQAKVMAAAKLELEKEIFERQQVESALQETTTLQRAILDSANYAIISTSLDGTILTFNAAAERWLGYTASEMVGKTTPAIIHDAQEVLRRAIELSQELETTIEPGFEVFVAKARCLEVEEREWTYIRKDGSRFSVLLSVTALRDNEGKITGFLGISSDITERKQTQIALLQSEERFKAFMNNSPAVAFMKDEQGRFVYINQPFERYFNIKMADWLGKTDLDVWPKELALQYRENDRAVLAADKSLEVVEIVPNPDGHLRHWLSFKFPCQDISGQRLLGSMAIDITERLQAQAALQQANDKLSRSVDELEQRHHEFALLSELSDFLQACKTVQEAYTALEQLVPPLFPQANGGIFLINESKNLVEAVANWGSSLCPSQDLFAPDECWALRRGRMHHTAEAHSRLRCSHIHSNLSPVPSLCIPMMAQGKAMGILYLSLLELGGLVESKQQLAVTVADHIALALANLKLRETLQNQSIRDPLTGLFNRRYLEESLERELHRCNREQQSLGIIMIDIDHFKSFNDTFGHSAGDAVLRELGQFLQSHIRKSDIACRYGGEELTLILPEASVEVVLERAQTICEGVKQLQVQHRRRLLGTISLSLGVAMFPDHSSTASAVLQAADTALYRAKQQGRDRVIIYQ